MDIQKDLVSGLIWVGVRSVAATVVTSACLFSSSENSVVGSSGHVFDTMALEIEQLLAKVSIL